MLEYEAKMYRQEIFHVLVAIAMAIGFLVHTQNKMSMRTIKSDIVYVCAQLYWNVEK